MVKSLLIFLCLETCLCLHEGNVCKSWSCCLLLAVLLSLKEICLNLGDCYYRLKKFAEAETYLLQAKENGQEKAANPRLASISLMKAKASLKAKNYQEALDNANASLGYDSTSAAYETAGDAFKGLGKDAEAIASYEQALPEAKPKAVNQLKYKIAAAAQVLGDKAKAIEYYNMILGDPNFGEFAKYQIAELSK